MEEGRAWSCIPASPSRSRIRSWQSRAAVTGSSRISPTLRAGHGAASDLRLPSLPPALQIPRLKRSPVQPRTRFQPPQVQLQQAHLISHTMMGHPRLQTERAGLKTAHKSPAGFHPGVFLAASKGALRRADPDQSFKPRESQSESESFFLLFDSKVLARE